MFFSGVVASEYSIPSPDDCEPVTAPPPSLQNSADEIDLTCWPWGEEWTNCSNIELFSDACDTSDYCNANTNISNIELEKNIIEDDSFNDKLNIFQNSAKINDLFNSLPLAQCKLIESSDIKLECDFVPDKKFLVQSDEESSATFTAGEHFSRDIITTLQSNILDDKCLLSKDEESLLPLQFQPSIPIKCSDHIDKTEFQLCENRTNNNGISIKCKKNERENSICEKLIDSPINNNLKLNNDSTFNPHKKLCVDQTVIRSNKSRYFMRSSSNTCYDPFQSKIPQLLDENKNLQSTLKSTKFKCSLRNPNNKYYQCEKNDSIKNNEQLNYSTTKSTSVNFNSNKIRFPKLDSHWISLRGNITCQWDGCVSHFSTSAKLIEHLQVCEYFIYNYFLTKIIFVKHILCIFVDKTCKFSDS